MRGMSKVISALVLVLLPCACAYKEPIRQTEAILVEAEGIGVLNAKAPFPGVMTSGQPTREQFVELSEAGYRTFVNLRVPTEEGTGWERKLAGELGARYYSIPVKGAEGLTEENALEFAQARDDSRGPMVVYCASGNRAGAMFALEAYYVDGKSAKKALAIGKSAGVTKLEPALRQTLGLESE